MNTLDQLAEMAEAIHSATVAVETAAKTKTAKPKKPAKENCDKPKKERPEGSGLIYNDKGIPTALDESYWMEIIAETGNIIFDPICDAYYLFADGLWKRIARAEATEWVAQQITELCPECPPKLRTRRAFNEIALRLAGNPKTVKRDAFATIPHGVILCRNGRLEISRTGEISFDEGNPGKREDMRQTRLDIDYKPCARPVEMIAWLTRIFSARQDDIDAVQNMMGAVLWGSSRWKKMVYINGQANLGKSQIPLMVERLAGRQVCVDFETRRLGEKFEFHRFLGKVFLRAEDVDGDFMTRGYSDALKQLTGFGSLRVEAKNSRDEYELRGDKIVCATSNFRPRVRGGVDRSAWEERLVYLVADGVPYAVEEQDGYFLDTLFDDEEEASGILWFALEGLKRLLSDGWKKSDLQKARVEAVMDQGGHVETWVEKCIEKTAPGIEDPARPGLTIGEAWKSYQDWCEENSIEGWPQQAWTEMAKSAVEDIHRKTTCNSLTRGGNHQRGWKGLCLRVAFNPQAS